MNPVKLLASRNIIIGIGIIGVLFVAFVILQTRSGSSETMPSAARFGAPPSPTGDPTPLDTVVTAYQRSRSATLRHYRDTPLIAHVEGVEPVGRNGWAAAVGLDGGRVTAYFADDVWRSIAPPVAAGTTVTFTCADWQSGPSGTVAMYGCGVVDRH